MAFARGEAEVRRYRVHVPERIDVRAIRVGLKMTQEEFAARFGFSLNTLRHWEQGMRQPEGSARASRCRDRHGASEACQSGVFAMYSPAFGGSIA